MAESAFTLFNQPTPTQIRSSIGKARQEGIRETGLKMGALGPRGAILAAAFGGAGAPTQDVSREEEQATQAANAMEQINAMDLDFTEDPIGSYTKAAQAFFDAGRTDLAFTAAERVESIRLARTKAAKSGKGRKIYGQDIIDLEDRIANNISSGNLDTARRLQSKLQKTSERDPGEGFKTATNTKISLLTNANAAITNAQKALTMSSVGFVGNLKNIGRGVVGQLDAAGLTSMADNLRSVSSNDPAAVARAKQDLAVISVAKSLASTRGGGGNLTKKNIEEAQNLLRLRDQVVDPLEVNQRLLTVLESNNVELGRLKGLLNTGKLDKDLIIKAGGKKIDSGPNAGWWIPIKTNTGIRMKKIRNLD